MLKIAVMFNFILLNILICWLRENILQPVVDNFSIIIIITREISQQANSGK